MNVSKSGEFDRSIEINTYKSRWLQSKETGNYMRIQKSKYPLQWIDQEIVRQIPKVGGLARMLGRKPQGVDYYKYYVDVLTSAHRGKWQDQFLRVRRQIESFGLEIESKVILDISGEPGFFAQDAREVCETVDVTAFAEEVALAITDILSISAKKYDFQSDSLTNLYEQSAYDFIFVRYAIGFCENLDNFIHQCQQLLRKEGVVYISFSPASRGVCARWMFDDYTYLRQFTLEYLTKSFVDRGFQKLGKFDEGSYRWDKNLVFPQKAISSFYTKSIFTDCSPADFFQHNVAVAFRIS